MEEKKEDKLEEEKNQENLMEKQEKNEEKSSSDEHEGKKIIREESKKMKNYLSIIILLFGLLIGSIFVDVAQLFSKQGVSPRALKDLDVLPFEGRTWVAYSEPVVEVKVITDSKCVACDPVEPIKWMKRVIPTLLAKKVEVDSEEGSNLVGNFSVKSLPAFIFDESITKTDIYSQAQQLFSKNGNNYLMDTQQVGIKAGKYLSLPDVLDTDSQIGPKDAKVKVVLFSDFQCPYCKMFHEQSFKKALSEYKDKVLFVFKQTPLVAIHNRAEAASNAALCAGEQGKFWEMADKLYANQDDWSKTTGDDRFKIYASSVGVNLAKLNDCLSQNKFKDQIAASGKQAADFGISGTPAFFINDQFFGGLVQYDEIKKAIDEQLAK